MSIIFGTDFSEPAGRAARAAAALAVAWHEPLILVHVLDSGDPESVFGGEHVPIKPLQRQLAEEAARLRSSGAEIREELLMGHPEEALVDHAEKTEARLIVLSALGRRARPWWRLGSTADRVAQTSTVPVLVVRDSEAFEGWAQGLRPLKTILGYDFSAPSQAALDWLGTLRKLGPCDVLVSHVYWPPEQYNRLGIRTPMDLVHHQPEVEGILLRDLERSAGKLEGVGDLRYRVTFSFGRVADPLTGLAEAEEADLLVVGSHQRKGTRKLWHGSAAQGVLHHAPCSVVVVPTRAAAGNLTRIPDLRRVLVPTDLSELGNQAIPSACSLLPTGGQLYLLHVVDEPTPPQGLEEQRRRLLAAFPQGLAEEAARRGIQVQAELVEHSDAARAICQTADRLGVDVVCMGSHGRSGLSAAIAGSVAQKVLRSSRRPILLHRAPADD